MLSPTILSVEVYPDIPVCNCIGSKLYQQAIHARPYFALEVGYFEGPSYYFSKG
jgi:hypothetical protein